MKILYFRFVLAIIVSSGLIFSLGCATQKQLYYFGDYSQTLYKSAKDQNDESLLKHKQELEEIISESEKRNLVVPPGIYAELGYLYLKANNANEAIAFFNKESEVYPESKYFMDRLISKSTISNDTDTITSDLSKETNLQSK